MAHVRLAFQNPTEDALREQYDYRVRLKRWSTMHVSVNVF